MTLIRVIYSKQSKFKFIWGGVRCCARGLVSCVPSTLPHSRAWMQSSDRIDFLPACLSLGSAHSYIVFRLSNCKDLNAYAYFAIYSSWANLVISMGLEHWACHTQDGVRLNLHIFALITPQYSKYKRGSWSPHCSSHFSLSDMTHISKWAVLIIPRAYYQQLLLSTFWHLFEC